MSGTEPEFLAIADISGYTSYLAGVELDHAQDILSDLTVTVVEAMHPFGLSKLEGDAAFMTAPAHELDGSALQDTIEGTYIAFQRRLRDIKQASTCACNACVRIPDLDLKIVVHHGPVARQQLMGLEELVGPSVILVHRLLKNAIRERHDIAAYALYTQAVIDATGIDPVAQGLIEHAEETDVAGNVTGWVRDLGRVWSGLGERPAYTIPPERLAFSIEFDSPVPPQLIFDHITSPAARLTWDAGIDSIDEDSSANAGRRGIGTTNHCMHGKDAFVERILDWRPPSSWATEAVLPLPGRPAFVKTETFDRLPDGGTHCRIDIGSVDGRTPAQDPEVFGFVRQVVEGGIATATAEIEAAHVRLVARRELAPPVPEGRDRHLTEPVGDAAR